jgi:nitronate monooxygenase
MFETLAIPIMQSPMVGASSFEMALAVTRAGAMGSLAAAAMTPLEIEAEAARFRAATPAPFAMNLFILEPARPDAETVDAAIARLRPWYEARGLEPPGAPNDYAQDFDAQFAALARAAPPVASFTFGVLTAQQVSALHDVGAMVVGTATTVAEARAWARVGADAICAQGHEAGGHRGTFLADAEDSLIGTLALTRLILEAVDLPVIAAGGIMDGRGVAAALALGAAAAQMGTAFLLSDQTAVSAPWRRAIETAGDDPTRLTRAFSGRYARGIENAFMREMRAVERDVPAYPVQNRLTQPLRACGARLDDPDVISLWAGQGVTLAEPGDAGALVERWWREAKEASAALARRVDPGPPGH